MAGVKQVILIRKDLKMRRGKEIAQGSHASMDFLVSALRAQLKSQESNLCTITVTEVEKAWMIVGMAKICLQVSSEQELLEHHQKALDAGLKSHLIRDSGKTEFGGVPTYTACAIGPDFSEKLDAVTGDLGLY
ncbi:MAG: aminoacyl-tRNA hydrolase [Oligoflexus sp.]|nr:aminoacyl-tRNA hydrolase [Oligoflexus sp.]